MGLVYSSHYLGQGLLAIIAMRPNYIYFCRTTLFGTTIAGWVIQVNLVIQVWYMTGLDGFHCDRIGAYNDMVF